MKQFFAGNPDWLVLDQTYQSVEETSAKILRVMSERLGEENSKWLGSSIWPLLLAYSLLWLLPPAMRHSGNGLMPGLGRWHQLTPPCPSAAEAPAAASELPTPANAPVPPPCCHFHRSKEISGDMLEIIR